MYIYIYIYIYIHTKSVSGKLQDWCYKQFNSILNNKLHSFLCKVTPLGPNVLYHPSLTWFYALLEGFFWDAPKVCPYVPLDGFHTFKMGSYYWGKEKSYMKQFQAKEVVVLLGQELPDAQHTQSCYFPMRFHIYIYIYMFRFLKSINYNLYFLCAYHLHKYHAIWQIPHTLNTVD